MSPALAHYREFAPCEALRDSVRAFFSFAPPEPRPARRRIGREVRFGVGDPFCSPVFADGHLSLVCSLGRDYRADGLWHLDPAGPRATAIGPMTAVGPADFAGRAHVVGAYFHPARAFLFTRAPASEMTDRVRSLRDLWGRPAAELLNGIGEADCEEERIDRLESALLLRMRQVQAPNTNLNVRGLAAYVQRRCGGVAVKLLADAAGVSRQHLTRTFRESVGVCPKTYCRLARFQAGLAFTRRGPQVDWAQAAAEMGYADQSHMIAEFRRFSSLTPGVLASRRWFHPFIERARDSIFPIARH